MKQIKTFTRQRLCFSQIPRESSKTNDTDSFLSTTHTHVLKSLACIAYSRPLPRYLIIRTHPMFYKVVLPIIFDGDLQTVHMYVHSFYCITKIIASRYNDSCIEYVVSYSSFSCIKHGCKIPPWLTLDKARIID